jgi:hypothetical protein
MKLIEVENMTAAEIKARRKELVEAINAEKQEEFARRYVDRVLDAKVRDEKLSEQGKQIAALQSRVEDLEKQLAGVTNAG